MGSLGTNVRMLRTAGGWEGGAEMLDSPARTRSPAGRQERRRDTGLPQASPRQVATR